MNTTQLERTLAELAGPRVEKVDTDAIRRRARRTRRIRQSVRVAVGGVAGALVVVVVGSAFVARAPAQRLAEPMPAAQPTPISPEALLDALRADDAAMVAALLEAGADPDASVRHGITPLMVAAVRGDAASIDILLDGGADIDLANEHDLTALHLAAQNGSVEVVERLLDRGARADRTPQRPWGVTPLMEAARHGSHEVVESMLERNADATVTDARGRPTVFYALDHQQPTPVLAAFRSAGVTIPHPSGDPRQAIVLSDYPLSELVTLLRDLDRPPADG